MRRLLASAFAVAVCSLSGSAAFQPVRPVERWQEMTWPFPRDGWPAGRAFHCAGEPCGDDVELYVRPKIGFCNCDGGVADDDEVDRVTDLDLMSERFAPREPGKAIRVAGIPGRLRTSIFRCRTARAMPRSASRYRGAATCWSRWRRARAPCPEFSVPHSPFFPQTTWRRG